MDSKELVEELRDALSSAWPLRSPDTPSFPGNTARPILTLFSFHMVLTRLYTDGMMLLRHVFSLRLLLRSTRIMMSALEHSEFGVFLITGAQDEWRGYTT